MLKTFVICVALLSVGALAANVTTDICTECEQVVGTIHMILSNNATEGQVLNAMQEFCTMLPAEYKTMCTEMVSLYGSEMIDALVKYLADPSKLCSLIGICNSTLTSQSDAFDDLHRILRLYADRGVDVFRVPAKLEGLTPCSICEFVTDLVQSTLMDLPMRDFAQSEFLQLCQHLPAADVDECKALVNTIEPSVYEKIVKDYLNPMVFCSGIDICPPEE